MLPPPVPVVELQSPDTQVCPGTQAMHWLPLAPQDTADVASTHSFFAVQQPEQFVGPQGVPQLEASRRDRQTIVTPTADSAARVMGQV